MSNSRPNILLIVTDQQTAETLSLYGNPVLQTPALERLAEQGVVFDLEKKAIQDTLICEYDGGRHLLTAEGKLLIKPPSAFCS